MSASRRLRSNRRCRLAPSRTGLVAWVLLAISASLARGGTPTGQAPPAYRLLCAWKAGESGAPMDVAVGPTGNVFVLDPLSNQVQKFSPAGQLLAAWKTRGSETQMQSMPHGIACSQDGVVYVAGGTGGVVQKFTADGKFVGSVGKGLFDRPHGIAVTTSGNLVVSDAMKCRIVKLSPQGRLLSTCGSAGSGAGQLGPLNWNDFESVLFNELLGSFGLDVDRMGGVWVADTVNNRVQHFDPKGRPAGIVQGSGDLGFKRPLDVAVDAKGCVYVTDDSATAKRIRVFASGSWVCDIGQGDLEMPVAVAVGGQDQVYVADMNQKRILVFGREPAAN